MNYPKGLISFTSEEELKGGKTHIVRPKLIGYALVLSVMVGLLAVEIMTRIPLEVDIIRDRNSLFRETNDGLIENVFTIKVLNKSQQQHTYQITVEGLKDARFIGDSEVTVQGGEVFSLPISVAVDPYNLEKMSTEFHFSVEAIGLKEDEIKVSEPAKFLYR